ELGRIDAIMGGQLLRPHAALDSRDQHALGEPAAHQLEAALEPTGAAGQHDDRVGRFVAGRLWQGHGEQCEADAVQRQQRSEDPERPADHSIRPSARRMVSRATSMASKTPNSGNPTRIPHAGAGTLAEPSNSEPSAETRSPMPISTSAARMKPIRPPNSASSA